MDRQRGAGLMRRLRAGLPIETDDGSGDWTDAPRSFEQLRSLLQIEIDEALSNDTSVLVFRIRHRPFSLGGTVDDLQFAELYPELKQRLRSVSSSVQAVGSAAGELVGFIPALRRRTDGDDLIRAIMGQLTIPVTIDGLPVLLGPHAGAVVSDPENQTTDDLFSASQLALNETDASRVTVMFHPYQRARHERSQELHHDLREALLHRQLDVCYQPDIDLNTGRLVAVKAYVRWDRSGKGTVPVADLLEAAKEASLLTHVGRHVLREGLLSAAGWIRDGLLENLTLWINVHPHEMTSPDFATTMIEAANYEPSLRLGMELTENPIEDRAFVYDVVRSLRARGITSALGDFGIGALDLSDFQKLPYDAVKIDRALTKQMATNANAAEVVRALVGMGRAMKLNVLANGIEDIEQMHQLREMGCATGQGYLFAKPMDTYEMTALLTEMKNGHRFL